MDGNLHPQQILHAIGAISVLGGISPSEPRIQALLSGAECSADWAPTAPFPFSVLLCATRKSLLKVNFVILNRSLIQEE